MRLPCTGVVLAGGAASRYGGLPKGLERVGGERIIDRVASALGAVTDDLLLVANDPAAVAWLPGVPVQGDIVPNAGGLGGIHAALHRTAHAVLIVAWDMPFVPTALLARLRGLGDGADVAVPESGSRRGIEPLCAFYAPSCLPAIEQSLASGDRRVVGFHQQVRVARLPASEVSAFGDPELLFMNVNTPDDLARAERHAASAHAVDHRKEAQRQDDAGGAARR
ncbi:MAG TPA: molybdenum cofactor guanylyltransferase [Gemmatimonadaceae bacterium]